LEAVVVGMWYAEATVDLVAQMPSKTTTIRGMMPQCRRNILCRGLLLLLCISWEEVNNSASLRCGRLDSVAMVRSQQG
jgi:hypothetical protein